MLLLIRSVIVFGVVPVTKYITLSNPQLKLETQCCPGNAMKRDALAHEHSRQETPNDSPRCFIGMRSVVVDGTSFRPMAPAW